MLRFDRNTVPYHITNLVFYLVTLVVVALVYYYAFLPPLLEVTTANFFATFGIGEFIGTLFFFVLIIVPFAIVGGAVYHLIKLVKNGKNVPAEH